MLINIVDHGKHLLRYRLSFSIDGREAETQRGMRFRSFAFLIIAFAVLLSIVTFTIVYRHIDVDFTSSGGATHVKLNYFMQQQQPKSRSRQVTNNLENWKSHSIDDVPATLRWWEPYVEDASRVWRSQRDVDWCQSLRTAAPATTTKIRYRNTMNHTFEGILFVKMPKASSSTGAGITMRIARKVAARKHNNGNNRTGLSVTMPLDDDYNECENHWKHAFAAYGGQYRRDRSRSVLWTILRHPSTRPISSFFHFGVSRNELLPNSTNMIDWLIKSKNKELEYFLAQRNRKTYSIASVKDAVAKFDFIGLAERMSESIAVLTLLLNLEHDDAIVLSSKISGSYDFAGRKQGCILIPKSFTTPEVDAFLAQSHPIDNYDYLLYDIANRSLDKTIDALGRDVVDNEAQIQRYLQRMAEENCRSKTVFPCSANGQPQIRAAMASCYAEDAGCGHDCVDKTLVDYGSK